MLVLVVKDRSAEPRRLEVASRAVIGRGDADIMIDDPQMSRRHALVRVAGAEFEIEDLGSQNGTWVNGRRAHTATLLHPGDVVVLGRTVLEVEASLQRDQASVADVTPAPLLAPPPHPPSAGRCTECNAEVASSARFCAYCGVSVQPAAALSGEVETPASATEGLGSTEDELRPVTALFADVVGSTALGERLAPHEVKSLIGECVNRMSHAVEQFGGSVQSYMGDGIAAFFGMPVAHEDDPDRAACAALRILEVAAEYAHDISTAWGVHDFNVRVGINSGQTAVGAVGAADRRQVALGDAPNVAARLQAAADPGTIVVGELTARRLAHRFVLESLGEITLKGREQPVSSWRLVGMLADTRTPAPTPLVGREHEAARLRVAFEELVAGRGQLLLLVGDPGIGKTRMLGELATMAGGRALWLEGNARSFGGELLYWPFAEVLRRWLGVESGEPEVAVRTKLRSKLATVPSLDTDGAIARLGALLGLHADTRIGMPTQPEELVREVRDAYCAWIEALCARQPVVLAIDDLHWIDAPTRELAEALLDVTDRAPLLLTVAFRADSPSEASRFRLHALEHYPHRTAEVTFEPLSRSAAEELLDMLIPDGIEPALRTEVAARAEGNPLYLEEFLRALVEEGSVERRGRTLALTRAPARNVPPALEGLLMARIDLLPDGARHLAQIAAVVGRSFPAKVLSRVAASEQFEADVSTLLRAQVIKELRRYPELVYSFKHGLLQECCLSTLTPARLQELYATVAGEFEELYAGARDEYLDVLASYYARSSNRPKALEYLQLAGARALSLNANAEATAMLKRALKVAAELGDAAAEQRIRADLDRLGALEVGVREA